MWQVWKRPRSRERNGGNVILYGGGTHCETRVQAAFVVLMLSGRLHHASDVLMRLLLVERWTEFGLIKK